MTDKPNPKDFKILKPQVRWENLYFYQKSDVIYQMSFVFCDRFIHLYKDRTRDQVIQAARSCKQNIVEGLADGVTSTETQMKLLNVARSSLKELREDFEDYVKSRHLKFYGNPQGGVIPSSYYDNDTCRYDAMLIFCRNHNKLSEYESYFQSWTDEELCNYGVTLCHMIDKMMLSFMSKLELEFVTEGGIKERMYKARTGYRSAQDDRLLQLETERTKMEEELVSLRHQLQQAQHEAQKWHSAYEDLKNRALRAYNEKLAEIEALKKGPGTLR